jgi:hypothetical protein
MSIYLGDILFTRDGRPTLVTSRNASTGEVTTNGDLKTIAKSAQLGIKNGLTPEQRQSFESVRYAAMSEDKKQEILDLRNRINSLKKSDGDRKVIRYLENELQHLIVREDYVPLDYTINERTLVK